MNSEVARLVRRYLERNPADIDTLRPLLELAAKANPVTSRTTTPGHVTCGAVAVSTDGHILQIRHKTLGHWLLPGGHVESADRSLLDAAVRELAEEAGILPEQVTPISVDPLDIDAHEIPANPSRDEAAHLHYDFRFLLRTAADDATVALQSEEVTGHRWVTPSELAPSLASKVTEALRQASTAGA